MDKYISEIGLAWDVDGSLLYRDKGLLEVVLALHLGVDR